MNLFIFRFAVLWRVPSHEWCSCWRFDRVVCRVLCVCQHHTNKTSSTQREEDTLDRAESGLIFVLAHKNRIRPVAEQQKLFSGSNKLALICTRLFRRFFEGMIFIRTSHPGVGARNQKTIRNILMDVKSDVFAVWTCVGTIFWNILYIIMLCSFASAFLLLLLLVAWLVRLLRRIAADLHQRSLSMKLSSLLAEHVFRTRRKHPWHLHKLVVVHF